MPHATTRARRPAFMNMAVYLTAALMVCMALLLVPGAPARAATAALCGVFAAVYRLGLPAAARAGRLRHYLAAQTLVVAALIATAGTNDPFGFLFVILALQAVMALPLRESLGWGALFLAIGAAAALLERGVAGTINVVFNALALGVTMIFGHTLRENERLLAELREAQRQLRAVAAAEERGRLARDLHDSAKQQAFALSAQLDAARSRFRHDPEGAERHLAQAEQLADGLRQELAALILDLRPPALGEGDLPGALRAYAARWSQHTGIAAEVQVSGAGAVPRRAEEALLRIAQEALANVGRHSGARRVRLSLAALEDFVELAIRDDGQGFDPGRGGPGVGLASMRERAQALPGGSLAIESAPGAGTRVTARCSQEGGV